MLWALNVYSDVCQLLLNKIENKWINSQTQTQKKKKKNNLRETEEVEGLLGC